MINHIMKCFGLWKSPWGASYRASSCSVQIDKYLLKGFVLLCMELDYGRRQCHDLPCHILIVSNYGSVVIGVEYVLLLAINVVFALGCQSIKYLP